MLHGGWREAHGRSPGILTGRRKRVGDWAQRGVGGPLLLRGILHGDWGFGGRLDLGLDLTLPPALGPGG